MSTFKETKSKKPCGGCPFKRENTNEKPYPGGSHPFVYLGQTRGPFWLPCHQDKNYTGKGSDTTKVCQCRGAAIFRSNCDSGYKLPEPLLSLPADKELVFANEAEFVAHYFNEDVEFVKPILTKETLDRVMHEEMTKKSDTRREYPSS